MNISDYAALLVDGKEYKVAFVREDAGWDIVKTFWALNDEAANRAAGILYEGTEWYVLDASGRNINGGHDQ